ncbi:hypothetical protein D8S82_03755 [Mycobacterium hodleri]|uniref:Uncharacterized protein n=1 Tax=Mycolicibacterium hodleri TaxID=49897 RepID=A0A544W7K2_9MYCO|nr:hypothetical protein D8S82_03755 [Mycolicibacterium hodleri]
MRIAVVHRHLPFGDVRVDGVWHGRRHTRRSRTNSSRRWSSEVKRSTSSPPSHRSSAIVTPCDVCATTSQMAPASCHRTSSAT